VPALANLQRLDDQLASAQCRFQRLDLRAQAEFKRALISERTKVGLASARARERNGAGQYKMTPAKLRRAMAAVGQKETVGSELCKELDITRQTIYQIARPKIRAELAGMDRTCWRIFRVTSSVRGGYGGQF
jgi:DNA invertase Pin-like site-specific DNA recombinase